jgi:PAS domain S-box-containing protein
MLAQPGDDQHSCDHIQTLYRAILQSATTIIITDPVGRVEFVNPHFTEKTGYAPDELLGRTLPLLETDPTPHHGSPDFWNMIRAGHSWKGEVRSSGKSGSQFWEEVTVSPVADDHGAVTHLVVASNDITLRRELQESLRESEHRYRSLFEGMLNGVAYCQVITEDEQPVDFVYLTVNSAFERLTGLQNVVGKKVSEVIPGFARSNPDLLAVYGRVAATRQPETLEAFVPVLKMWFSISVYSPEPGYFVAVFDVTTNRKKAEEALRSLLEQTRNLDLRLERSREEERRAISREVHDELGQVLTALKLDLMKMRKHVRPGDRVFDAAIEGVLALNDSAMKSVQDISARLRPGLLDDIGLVPALEWQTEEFQKRTGIACELDLPAHDPGIDADRSTALFRILQECLTNVARHARATSVSVLFAVTEESLSLTIADDGIGIAEENIELPTSLGLLGIRERLRPFDGSLTIERVQPTGTCLRVMLLRKSAGEQ